MSIKKDNGEELLTEEGGKEHEDEHKKRAQRELVDG